jgi:RNA polymerase sigma factor (sigma-70 family)
MATTKAKKQNQQDRKKNNRVSKAGVEYIYNPLFASRKAEQRLWGPDREKINVPRYNLLPQVDAAASTRVLKRASLSAEQEKTLFLRYNYAKFREAKVRQAMRKRSTAKRRKEADLWKKRSEHMREKIVHANLPLVPSMAQRANVSGVEFTELMSEGYMAILRSVEKFDISRGFKFSTYACRAILAAFHRMGTKNHTYRKHVPVQFDIPIERSDFADQRHTDERLTAVEAVRKVLKANIADLSEMEARIIRQRFPMLDSDRPRTLAQVGRNVGLSNERVRQIEKRGLAKIRSAVEDTLAA